MRKIYDIWHHIKGYHWVNKESGRKYIKQDIFFVETEKQTYTIIFKFFIYKGINIWEDDSKENSNSDLWDWGKGARMVALVGRWEVSGGSGKESKGIELHRHTSVPSHRREERRRRKRRRYSWTICVIRSESFMKRNRLSGLWTPSSLTERWCGARSTTDGQSFCRGQVCVCVETRLVRRMLLLVLTPSTSQSLNTTKVYFSFMSQFSVHGGGGDALFHTVTQGPGPLPCYGLSSCDVLSLPLHLPAK